MHTNRPKKSCTVQLEKTSFGEIQIQIVTTLIKTRAEYIR